MKSRGKFTIAVMAATWIRKNKKSTQLFSCGADILLEQRTCHIRQKEEVMGCSTVRLDDGRKAVVCTDDVSQNVAFEKAKDVSQGKPLFDSVESCQEFDVYGKREQSRQCDFTNVVQTTQLCVLRPGKENSYQALQQKIQDTFQNDECAKKVGPVTYKDLVQTDCHILSVTLAYGVGVKGELGLCFPEKGWPVPKIALGASVGLGIAAAYEDEVVLTRVQDGKVNDDDIAGGIFVAVDTPGVLLSDRVMHEDFASWSYGPQYPITEDGRRYIRDRYSFGLYVGTGFGKCDLGAALYSGLSKAYDVVVAPDEPSVTNQSVVSFGETQRLATAK